MMRRRNKKTRHVDAWRGETFRRVCAFLARRGGGCDEGRQGNMYMLTLPFHGMKKSFSPRMAVLTALRKFALSERVLLNFN